LIEREKNGKELPRDKPKEKSSSPNSFRGVSLFGVYITSKNVDEKKEI